MVKFSGPTIKHFLTAYGIEDDGTPHPVVSNGYLSCGLTEAKITRHTIIRRTYHVG